MDNPFDSPRSGEEANGRQPRFPMMSLRLLRASALACVLPALVLAAPAAKSAKPAHISMGEKVVLKDHLVAGKTVIFDFYSDYCPPCRAIAPELEKLHAANPDVVVVKVDINRPGQKGIDWKSPVAEQFQLRSIPHFKVYGPDGALRAEDGADSAKAREIVIGLLRG